MADEKELKEDTPQTAKQQQGDRSWPIPGDEGYVHPDGTPQSVKQLEDNRRAAADRAAAGSSVHGAPMATPGPQAYDEQEAAIKRAEADSPVTDAEARQGQTEFIREGMERAAEKASDESADAARANTAPSSEPANAKADATKRTATTEGGKATR